MSAINTAAARRHRRADISHRQLARAHQYQPLGDHAGWQRSQPDARDYRFSRGASNAHIPRQCEPSQ
jgi:hypothetical protein